MSSLNSRGYSIPQLSVPSHIAVPLQKPDIPLEVFLATYSDSASKIYWKHPQSDGGDMVTKYKIEWDTKETFDSNNNFALGSHDVSLTPPSTDCKVSSCYFVISNLVKGTPYFVRVYSYNSYGFSNKAALSSPSNEIPKTQPSPPAVFNVVSSTSGVVLEFPESSDNGGADIDHYVVDYDIMGYEAYLNGANTNEILYSPYEVQTISLTSDSYPTSGSFRVAYDGQVSTDLAHDISASNLKDALEAIPTIGEVQFLV